MATILYFSFNKPGNFSYQKLGNPQTRIYIIYKTELQSSTPAKVVPLAAVPRQSTWVPEPKKLERCHLALVEYAKVSLG